MRYSVRERRWYGLIQRRTAVDPYSQQSPGHTERHREHTWTEPSGIIRTDMGGKPPRP